MNFLDAFASARIPLCKFLDRRDAHVLSVSCKYLCESLHNYADEKRRARPDEKIPPFGSRFIRKEIGPLNDPVLVIDYRWWGVSHTRLSFALNNTFKTIYLKQGFFNRHLNSFEESEQYRLVVTTFDGSHDTENLFAQQIVHSANDLRYLYQELLRVQMHDGRPHFRLIYQK